MLILPAVSLQQLDKYFRANCSGPCFIYIAKFTHWSGRRCLTAGHGQGDVMD